MLGLHLTTRRGLHCGPQSIPLQQASGTLLRHLCVEITFSLFLLTKTLVQKFSYFEQFFRFNKNDIWIFLFILKVIVAVNYLPWKNDWVFVIGFLINHLKTRPSSSTGNTELTCFSFSVWQWWTVMGFLLQPWTLSWLCVVRVVITECAIITEHVMPQTARSG